MMLLDRGRYTWLESLIRLISLEKLMSLESSDKKLEIFLQSK